MNQQEFIAGLSKKLGRSEPLQAAPDRPFRGVPDFYANREPLSTEQKIEQYVHNLTALTGKVLIVKEQEAALAISAYIRQICGEFAVKNAVRWAHPELEALALDAHLREDGIQVLPWAEETGFELAEEERAAGGGSPNSPSPAIPAGAQAGNWSRRSKLLRQAERCRLGIVWADYAVCETGTVALCAKGGQGRSVSLLPEILVSIFRADQLLRTMGEAFAAIASDKRYAGMLPSSINLITGPSRSADIENDLTIGVHGPGKVYTVIIE